MREADLETALADADALPRDLQVALARLVWRIVDASQLQEDAFATLTPAERQALWTLREDDLGSLRTAVPKVDVAAVLGAGRAVDQAVKEAEPVLRKWSLLLQARHDLVGRAAHPAGVAASATQLDSEGVARAWVLGLADRPHAPTPDLPVLPLSQALLLFYAVNGVPMGVEQAAGLKLIDFADPAIRDPLSRAVVATAFAEMYVADGLVGETGVDARRFLELDAEAARIAASDGATPEELALLEEYASAAHRIADTPVLTAAELLFLAAGDLSASSATAAPASRGPAVRLATADSKLAFPTGGSMTVHNAANGTSVSFDLDGDGRDDVWPPVSTGGVRLGSDDGQCRYVLYQEKHNNEKIDPDEPLLPVSASLCDAKNNVTLKDPYGYFVVGGEGRTVYDDRFGGEVVSMWDVRDQVGRAEGSYNASFAGDVLDRVLRLTQGSASTDGATIPTPFGPIPVSFAGLILCGFSGGAVCPGAASASGGGLNVHRDGFNNLRRSNFTVNSNHYQFVVWDLGGDDVYRTNAGGTLNWTEPYMMRRLATGDPAGLVALVVDVGEGNDTYAGSRNYTVGSAQLGVALLRDEGGADVYSGPDDSVASSAGVRRQPPGFAACDPDRSCRKGHVYGDSGVTQKVGTETVVQDEETKPPEPGASDFTIEYRKAASAFATILDLEGNDSYRARDRGLAFANQSFAFLLDLDGRDRYDGREFVQGVANNSGMRLDAAPSGGSTGVNSAICAVKLAGSLSSDGCFPTVSVAALVDRAGNDTYVTAGRSNMSQGRGIGNASAFGFLPLTVGLLADLAGNDTGIRRNGNVTLGDGLVDVGFRTRHVHRGPVPANEQTTNYPSSGVSLALDLNLPTAVSNATFQPKGAYFALPASHVDMDEDPLFALDLYVDVPRLFVLGTEAGTRYEHDAVVLVELGGGDTYLAPVGAATFDWNRTTSHDGRARGAAQEKPAPEGVEVFGGTIVPNALTIGCRDFTGKEHAAACTLGTYEHRRVAPVALTLDVSGGDNYTGVLPNGTPVRGFGYGYGGVGALYDLGTAHDNYNVSAVGLGAGELFGVGVLFDAGGDDGYRMVDGKRARLPSSSFGLGFAHAGGVGIAIDAGRLDAPGDDVYQVHNFTLGSILVDFSREYALFYDAGGRDVYNATARSVGHAEEVPGPLRGRVGEFDGLFNPAFGAGRDWNSVWCYEVQNAKGDAQAEFVDDGLALDRYSPVRAAGGNRTDNTDWGRIAGAGPRYLEGDHPEDCQRGIYSPQNSPPSTNRNDAGGGDNAAATTPNANLQTAVRGAAWATGIDNLDAYYNRQAVKAMGDPSGSTSETGTATPVVPLDEVLAVRAILLSPAAEFRTPTSNPPYSGTYVRDPAPIFRDAWPAGADAWPVGVVATHGASSIRTNALAFAEFLLADTVPRTTCSFVPHPTQTARGLSTSDNPDPAEGGRPPVAGAAFTPNVRPLGNDYRQYGRTSREMGYCGDLRDQRSGGESIAEDPCRAETYEVKGQRPYELVAPRPPEGVGNGPVSVCRDVVDPNPFLDPAQDGVDRLDVPLAAQGLPVLAEALRLAGETSEELAPQVEGLNRILAEALVHALQGDLVGARGSLDEGFEMQLGAERAPGNPCDPKNPNQQVDDCQDVGRLEFYALQGGKLRFLGSWDNAFPSLVAGINVTVLPLSTDKLQNVYVAGWRTNQTTGRTTLWPDGAYDVLVRTTYRENGGIGSGADPRLYVRPESTVPAFPEVYRRVHDEYGYYPGENWINVTVDNRPSLLPEASRFGHFRPGIDATKTVRLAFSEPVSSDSTVTLVPTGGTELPRTFALTEQMGAIRCAGTEAPRGIQHPTVIQFEMDVSGRRPGEYKLVVRPRDCSHIDGAANGDGRKWSQWSFEAKVLGDLSAPLGDVGFARDFLNPADLVPCEDAVVACVDVPLVADVEEGRAERESPIDTWFVDLVERLPNGDVRSSTNPPSEEPVVRLRPIHGAIYTLSIRALDEAGNLQLIPTVRELAYDALAPRVAKFVLPDTVRPDGVLEAAWTLESADPAFPSDTRDVVLEWATGPIPEQGEDVRRVWRPVPAGMVDQGLGVARIPVQALADQFSPALVSESQHENYTR
ncbi:MAG TPA: hypothetical protein VI997_01265, partial [Candidatus Thermoplasmatota archaeon]|nr:hypothetical protein [Candidatus Thermoplasmatota archaeon]